MGANPLVGKKVTAVFLASDGGAIKFEIEGSDPVIARADGDCCSHSWIENVEMPQNLLGTVSNVEDLNLDSKDFEDGLIRFYGCNIVTNQGVCTLDYRNESNGYYGGNLVWGDEDFYGGVFGQNVSNEDWKQIAPQVALV